MNHFSNFSNLAIVIAVGVFVIFSSSKITASEPAVVRSLNLQRYQGQWFEIARFSNPFQKQCKKNVTATYTLMDNGYVEVINACTREDGQEEGVRGLAKVMDTQNNAKLGVSFFNILGWRPIWGDYWVLGLGPDYSFTVVGDRKRKYGWILSRTKQLSEEQLQDALNIFDKNGYDSTALTYTHHDS
jgi:apolipoprotein D and lipocalin family protein